MAYLSHLRRRRQKKKKNPDKSKPSVTDSWYLTSWKLIWLNLFIHDAINSIWLLLRAFKQTPENYLQNAAWLRWVADTRAVICFFLQEFEHKRARCPTPPRVHSTVDVLSHSVCSCWDGRIDAFVSATDISTVTTQHPTQSLTVQIPWIVLWVCVSHFTQQEGTAPLQNETLLKCTWF